VPAGVAEKLLGDLGKRRLQIGRRGPAQRPPTRLAAAGGKAEQRTAK
jgi:hypothetical protein